MDEQTGELFFSTFSANFLLFTFFLFLIWLILKWLSISAVTLQKGWVAEGPTAIILALTATIIGRSEQAKLVAGSISKLMEMNLQILSD